MEETTRLGVARSIDPPGALPQAARVLDADPVPRAGELALDVERLNVDAASFRQLAGEAEGSPERLGQRVAEIVRERGKLHNPVTGSGGMLLGRVRALGPGYEPPEPLAPGDRVATLVSLTLTPLRLDEVLEVDMDADQVAVRGSAIVFQSGNLARVPDDLPERLVLSVLDVCGAPAHVRRRVEAGAGGVLVLGAAGKSGVLSLAAAEAAGAAAHGICRSPAEVAELREHGFEGPLGVADATEPVALAAAARELGGPFDLVVDCTSVAGVEGGAALATREGGSILFFNMSTSFQRAALGAEGFARDVELAIGNGYVPGAAPAALDLVRGRAGLRALLERRAGLGTPSDRRASVTEAR